MKKKTDEPVKEKTNGIFCPACRFVMRVYRTKALSGSVVRERVCDRCGTRQDTEETVFED
jgi:transcriptional regulator NrdR family protein